MNSLLPPGSTPLERRLAQTCSGISDLQVPLRDLWNPATCPVSFLPYLAWASLWIAGTRAGQKASSARW
ncbi:phage tail protein I [Escherichia coli]|nr:phage tail protein I [Escherichia coli]